MHVPEQLGVRKYAGKGAYDECWKLEWSAHGRWPRGFSPSASSAAVPWVGTGAWLSRAASRAPGAGRAVRARPGPVSDAVATVVVRSASGPSVGCVRYLLRFHIGHSRSEK